jgi:1-acyl-sn-glycerol-3-phosphate acyltransferase
VKPRELRYRLLWGHRYGFVRAAVRNRAPIVPLACIGGDDLFTLVGNAYHRGARWLPWLHFPIPRPAGYVPWPHRVRLRYVIGEPISCEGVRLDDDSAIHRLRREIEGALHELIENELARRAGIEAT